VNRFVCRVQLCDGNWGRQISEGTVADVVESCANVDRNLVRLDFLDVDGDDVLLAFEVEVVTHWSHSEIVRDALIDALLQWFQPEYDSMIEVEVLDD
jgi:hypothetical protein